MTGVGDASDEGLGAVAARTSLLATKLHVPAIRGHVVHRGALLQDLSASGGGKLTLMSAPAGWGKTTSLAQWALTAQDEQRFGWLSLDSSDNDPMWFWMYAIAALQRACPEVGSRPSELLEMGADLTGVVLPTLMNEVDAVAAQTILILDDYHLVVSRAINEQLAFVINRMPANLHLVLSTRSDPILPLPRLRASGVLTELRTDDLRFEPKEAADFLNRVLGLHLSEVDVELLHARTEGWAAGLYLAALSLAGSTDTSALIKTFAGDNRHIVDYLMAEVLDVQPHLRRFMLRTSILRRLSGPLCDAVLDSTGSAEVLEAMERDNLFLVPVDLSRRWYRYHHLFAELLRTELERTESDVVAGLHERAAAWFGAEGLIDAAVRHLSAAGDDARTADLIAKNWVNEFNRGGLSRVSGWLDSVRNQTVLQHPRLGIARSWIALNEGRVDDAAFWIEAVQAAAASDPSADATIPAQATILRAVHSFKLGDVAACLKTAGPATTLDLGMAPLARSAVYCIYGNALYFSGRTDEARTSYQQAVQRAEQVGDRRYRIYALGYLALIAAERGQVTEAEYLIRRANGGGADLAAEEYFVGVMVCLAAAIVLDSQGDSAGAADAASMAVVSARQGGAVPEIVKALSVKSVIIRRLGNDQTAGELREEAAALAHDRVRGGIMPQLFAATHPEQPSAAAFSRQTGGPADEDLTLRELEILRLLATWLSRREIGDQLYVSLNTIKTHQRAIYRKLGVDNREDAVRRARELGLV